MLKQRHRCWLASRPWRAAAAATMMVLFSLLLAASLSREIHHFFHADSQSPEHHCVATQMVAGHLLESPVVTVWVTPAWPETALVIFFDLQGPAAGDLRLMPGRAPPCLNA